MQKQENGRRVYFLEVKYDRSIYAWRPTSEHYRPALEVIYECRYDYKALMIKSILN